MAWGAVSGRSAEIADALGGEARCFYPPGRGRVPGPRPLPALHRPHRRLPGQSTTGPGHRDQPAGGCRMRGPGLGPVVRRLRRPGQPPGRLRRPGGHHVRPASVAAPVAGRRVDLTMVTAAGFCRQVESWGGTAVIVHEAPGTWSRSRRCAIGAPGSCAWAGLPETSRSTWCSLPPPWLRSATSWSPGTSPTAPRTCGRRPPATSPSSGSSAPTTTGPRCRKRVWS